MKKSAAAGKAKPAGLWLCVMISTVYVGFIRGISNDILGG